MPVVKRLVRLEPGMVATGDGYLYEWPEGGEAVDVLPQHRRPLLATKGAHLVDVEVVDEPIILPVLKPVEPLKVARVAAPEPFVDDDLSYLDVPPADLPEVEPLALSTVAPLAPPIDADLADAYVDPSSVPVKPEPAPMPPTLTLPPVLSPERPATDPAPAHVPDPTVRPNVNHRWSDADLARLEG